MFLLMCWMKHIKPVSEILIQIAKVYDKCYDNEVARKLATHYFKRSQHWYFESNLERFYNPPSPLWPASVLVVCRVHTNLRRVQELLKNLYFFFIYVKPSCNMGTLIFNTSFGKNENKSRRKAFQTDFMLLNSNNYKIIVIFQIFTYHEQFNF